MTIRVYLGLGANLGDSLANLQKAVAGLGQEPRVEVQAVSSVYSTAPVGGPAQPDYLNAVVAIDTDLNPEEVLALAHALEANAQRERTVHWGPRTLDIDVLLYGAETIVEPDLIIPHPRMWERGFVVIPLAEIAPELVSASALAAVTDTAVVCTDLVLVPQ